MSAKRAIQLSLIVALMVVTFAAAPAAKASSNCPATYVVRPGDWLAKIARNCGVSLSSMYAANPGVGYYIYPGQRLAIPGGYYGSTGGLCGPGTDAWGRIYIVCPGDTLGSIAAYYGTTWRRLQAINGITNANRIYAGQFLRIY